MPSLILDLAMILVPRPGAVLALLLAAPVATQGWVAGPTVVTPGNVARADGKLVVSPAGTFLMGGTPVDGNGDATVQQLTAAGWVTTTPLESLFSHGGATVDELGRILVIAGVDSSGDMGDAYEWDVANGNAGGIEDRSGQESRQGFALARDDLGRILSIGGSSLAALTTAYSGGDVERYDAVNDQWTFLASMPTPVADASACNDGQGHVLVFGGYTTAGTRTANVATYDLATDVWSDTAIPDMPTARAGSQAVLGNDGLLYVLGGSTNSAVVSTVLVLDPVSATWAAGASMLQPREHFGCGIDGAGNIWAVGGDGTNTSEKMFTSTCPTIVAGPTGNAAYVGTVASLSIAVGGSGPLTFTWRANGVPLVDGPSSSGSIIQGAATTTLTFQFPTLADAALGLDCVVSNACGTATSPVANLNVQESPALPTAFLVESLHPVGATSSSLYSVDDTFLVGSVSYLHPQWNTLTKPTLWHALGTGSVVDLTPSNSVGGSCAKIRNGTIVGWWWWPYTNQFGTGYNRHASSWTTAGSHQDRQPSGFEFAAIADTDGAQHAGSGRYDEGSTNSDAFRWVGTGSASNLTPATVWGGSAVAVDSGLQFGSVHIGFGVVHAAMWSGTASSFVDMHPPVTGSGRSYITAASDGLQVGQIFYGNTAQPGMWGGTPESFTELTVPGETVSVRSTRYGLILGSVTQNGASRAAIFRHGVSQWLDMSQFVPPWFSGITVRDLYVDAVSGEMTVVGSGYNNNTSRSEALVWRPASVAAMVDRIGQPTPVTIEFTPNAIGGYDVARTSPLWFDDSVVGSEIAAGGLLPADAMTPAQSLGFPFTMPGGSQTSQVFVDDNGRVVADPLATSSNSPGSYAMRVGPAVIAPFWADLNASAGSVKFYGNPSAGFATITWRDVPQAGSNNQITLQLRLRDDGSFAITYQDLNEWQPQILAGASDVLIGCSAGNGVSYVAPIDFSVYPIASGGNSLIYQAWLAGSGPAHGELQAHLHVTQQAVVGGSLGLELGGTTSASLLSFAILGLQDPNVDVTALLTGMPGLSGTVLHASLDGVLPMTGNSYALTIPQNNALIGMPLWAQGLDVAPGESLLGLVLSDAFAVTIGG